MFRNLYDSDITTYSPQGKLYQIEYAMEAVKQGSACIALKSKTHACLVTLQRAPGKLSSYQRKIFDIDEHLGIAIAGLTADARILTRYMRNECINHKYVYETPMQTKRLVLKVADKSQKNTQNYGRRPYGVGMLVVGYDRTGPHVYETSPSGEYYDYKAQSIGARYQSAKTYLQKAYDDYAEADLDTLIMHGLLALRETISSTDDTELNSENTAVAVVGVDTAFTLLDSEALQPHLDRLEERELAEIAEDDEEGEEMET